MEAKDTSVLGQWGAAQCVGLQMQEFKLPYCYDGVLHQTCLRNLDGKGNGCDLPSLLPTVVFSWPLLDYLYVECQQRGLGRKRILGMLHLG